MLNVLLVDSWLLNNKVIEQDSQNYFEKNNIQYNFFESSNSQETIEILKKEHIDILFIDISSEKFDGIQLVKDIKAMDIRQPKMVAVTVLYDKKYRYEALKLKVYRYIYKPYDFNEIQEALAKLFNENDYSIPINEYIKVFKNEENTATDAQEDDFLDFDDLDDEGETKPNNSANDDDFDFDFDDDEEDDVAHNKDLMDAYNQTHKQVTSAEFLESYADVGIDIDQFSELEEDLDTLISNILFDDINDKIPDIIYILEKYNRFLYSFSEFEELCKVIYALVEILNNTDFKNLKRSNMAKKFIVAILEDLVDWKNHVFVLEDAVDVYYINASILNSFVLLKDIVNK